MIIRGETFAPAPGIGRGSLVLRTKRSNHRATPKFNSSTGSNPIPLVFSLCGQKLENSCCMRLWIVTYQKPSARTRIGFNRPFRLQRKFYGSINWSVLLIGGLPCSLFPVDFLLTDLSSDNKTKHQRAHNLCVRFVSNVRKYDHITPSLEAIGWLKLDKKRNLHSLLFLFEILNSSILSYLSSRFTYLSSHHNLNTRSRHETILTIPSHRTSSYSSSSTIALPRLWNSLPASIRDCRNKIEFKRKLTRHLVNTMDMELEDEDVDVKVGFRTLFSTMDSCSSIYLETVGDTD
ncbi:hypothetical protein ANN_12517 [Periplaneta americana]|uniref:Uncharacterized protein n=1 Tax=Periplaneta americana TaxID=6978 RepID=A0ABQ8TJA9_PERAM|nr:hypothetical protein ANN_12517 [Periplaneta americana]